MTITALTKVSSFDDNTLLSRMIFFQKKSNATAKKKSNREYMLALLRTLGNSVRPLYARAERPQ